MVQPQLLGLLVVMCSVPVRGRANSNNDQVFYLFSGSNSDRHRRRSDHEARLLSADVEVGQMHNIQSHGVPRNAQPTHILSWESVVDVDPARVFGRIDKLRLPTLSIQPVNFVLVKPKRRVRMRYPYIKQDSYNF